MFPSWRPIPCLILALAASTLIATATVAEFQATAAAQPDLLHQYSFDGADETARLTDQKGGANLVPRRSNTPTQDLAYGEAGFDLTSDSVSIGRGPGADFADYAHLHADSITLGTAVSFEAIICPRQESITGGAFDLGYIIASRVDNDRGYFLVQGDGTLPSSTHPLSSTLGNGYNVPNTHIFSASPLNVDHWYYVAGSYTVDAGNTSVTWTNYVADLTSGTALNVDGPFTNSGGTYPLVPTQLGIGGRWDAGESFPGWIDEVNIYGAALDTQYFLSQWESLVGEQPPFEITDVSYDAVDGTTITFNSLPGLIYQIDESTDLVNWVDFNDNVPAVGTSTSCTDIRPKPPGGKRFYRVRPQSIPAD